MNFEHALVDAALAPISLGVGAVTSSNHSRVSCCPQAAHSQLDNCSGYCRVRGLALSAASRSWQLHRRILLGSMSQINEIRLRKQVYLNVKQCFMSIKPARNYFRREAPPEPKSDGKACSGLLRSATSQFGLLARYLSISVQKSRPSGKCLFSRRSISMCAILSVQRGTSYIRADLRGIVEGNRLVPDSGSTCNLELAMRPS